MSWDAFQRRPAEGSINLQSTDFNVSEKVQASLQFFRRWQITKGQNKKYNKKSNLLSNRTFGTKTFFLADGNHGCGRSVKKKTSHVFS